MPDRLVEKGVNKETIIEYEQQYRQVKGNRCTTVNHRGKPRTRGTLTNWQAWRQRSADIRVFLMARVVIHYWQNITFTSNLSLGLREKVG